MTIHRDLELEDWIEIKVDGKTCLVSLATLLRLFIQKEDENDG